MRHLFPHFILPIFLCLFLATPICAEEILPVEAEESESDEDEDNSWGYISEEEMAKRPAPTEFPPLEIVGGNAIDIGTLWQGQIKYLKVPLKNIGTAKWKLQEIEASCSCTSVDGIPGGKYLDPEEVWQMDVKVDTSKIPLGEFTRNIRLIPLDYKPVDLEIRGVVARFYKTLPSKSVMKFGFIRNPEDPWSASIEIVGIDSGKDILKLGELPTSSFFELTKEEISPGYWKITAKSTKPLYYASNFVQRFRIPVVEPKHCPAIPLAIAGKVGVPFEFFPRAMEIPPKYLKEDEPLAISTQLGFDPTASNPAFDKIPEQERQRLEDSYMSNVDWEPLMGKLEIRCPEGITAEKVFTRYGIRLDMKVNANAFTEKDALEVVAYAYDHPLATFKLKIQDEKKSIKFSQEKSNP